MNILLFSNVNLKPFANNLLPIVRAFQKRGSVRLVEPFHFPDFVGTGAARPARLPEQAIVEGLRQFVPDLALCVGGALFVPPELRARFPPACTFAAIALSDPYGFDASTEIAPLFDLFYTQDPQTLPFYLAAGIDARRCDPATDPELYHPVDAGPPICDVLYFGKWTPYRETVLRALVERFRLHVHAHSAEAARWSFPCLPTLDTPEELRNAINGAKSVVELAILDDAAEPFRGTGRMTNRAQIAAACGIPVLITDFSGVGEFFQPGEEIVTFRGPEDVSDRLDWLLEDEVRRVRIGRKARERVLRDQTWDLRAGMILDDAARRSAAVRT